MQEWHEPNFRGTDEAEVEEDLEEVKDRWYATIAKGQDIMPMILQTQRAHHICIVPCLIMRWKIILRW